MTNYRDFLFFCLYLIESIESDFYPDFFFPTGQIDSFFDPKLVEFKQQKYFV